MSAPGFKRLSESIYMMFRSVAAWLNFLGGANYEIGAPGDFVLFGALHHQVKK